jgi:Flp pilus assembly CpaF family ATPase
MRFGGTHRAEPRVAGQVRWSAEYNRNSAAARVRTAGVRSFGQKLSVTLPSREAWAVAELASRGIFRPLGRLAPSRPRVEAQLTALLAEERYEEIMRLAVASRQNILVSGPTGSGKTTWTKALISEIPPVERVVTIEDAQELVLDRHPNHVRLYYSKDDQGPARVTPSSGWSRACGSLGTSTPATPTRSRAYTRAGVRSRSSS